jgi:hypothetical protein
MQKQSTSRGKVVDSQRRQRTGRSTQTMLAVPAATGSGEVTLGGHADRGLTLSAFYETGVLERLRLEVRVRLIMDLTLSLAWLHENPRLMAAYSHLTVTPTTVVIGLDGVARVDVRAAKKRRNELGESDTDYLAPELSVPDGTGDHRADIFSLGVLAWEALAGRRLFQESSAPHPGLGAPGDDWRGDLPAALAGPAQRPERDAGRQRATARTAKASHARLRLGAPALSLPADAEWALPLFELAVQAMNLDVALRPSDCRSLLARLASIDEAHLATHQEIAEVVQGISAVATLCVAEPTLPSVDAVCREEMQPGAGRGSAGQVCSSTGETCAQPAPPAPRLLPVAAPPPVQVPLVAPPPVQQAQPQQRFSAPSLRAWFGVGLLWLATLSLVAGYLTSVMAHR